MSVNRPLYDTGYRVGQKMPGQGRRYESINFTPMVVEGAIREDGTRESDIVMLPGLGLFACAQNGLLDRKLDVCTPVELAEFMNRVARKSASGVLHWATEDQIHWADVTYNRDTGELELIRDWGLLLD